MGTGRGRVNGWARQPPRSPPAPRWCGRSRSAGRPLSRDAPALAVSLSTGRSVGGAQGDRGPPPAPEGGQEEAPHPAAPLQPAPAARQQPPQLGSKATGAGRAETQADPAGPPLLPVLPTAPLVLQAVTAAAAAREDPDPALGTPEPQGLPSSRAGGGNPGAAGQGCPGTRHDGPWEAPLRARGARVLKNCRPEAGSHRHTPCPCGRRLWGSDSS